MLGNLIESKEEGSNKEDNQMTKTYHDFIYSKPIPLYGYKGVDSLIHWIKEMERKCTKEHRVKFTTCKFMGRALI